MELANLSMGGVDEFFGCVEWFTRSVERLPRLVQQSQLRWAQLEAQRPQLLCDVGSLKANLVNLLLPLQCFFSDLVPSFVKLSSIFVNPLLWYMMRSMTCTKG